MSDAIKAALREAVARKRYTMATYQDEVADTAAAVAAFLRALPDRLTFGVPTKMLSDNQLHNIAVAVERAARDGGE